MDARAQFVVTPWRNSQELLELRHNLYGSDTVRRTRAVNKVFAWRLRKQDGLPLLLDSTADIVDVILQDERNELKHNALRLLYATALSRFITGLADTQIELTRDKPSWFPPGKTLQLPLPLLEIRHRIVHRHLPSLAELKRASEESLEWLWEWYWSQLDHAFGSAKPNDEDMEVEGIGAVRERLQVILKTYVKERKSEIKARKLESRAAELAMSTYNLRFAPSSTSIPSGRTRAQLLQLLIGEKMILPTDKKLGSSMSGAFLIWTPFLLAVSTSRPPVLSISTLLDHLFNAMNTSVARAMVDAELDPVREGMSGWILHILLSERWRSVRSQFGNLVEDTLIRSFSEPTFWNLGVAEGLLKNDDVPNHKHWKAVMEAAKSEDSINLDQAEETGEGRMDIDVEGMDECSPVTEDTGAVKAVKEKIKGPQKVVGMWQPRPIGWLPERFEDDE